MSRLIRSTRAWARSAGADKRQYDFQLSGSIGEISVQAGHSRFNDNLATHRVDFAVAQQGRSTFSVALPAAALWGGSSSTSNTCRSLSYSRSVMHQFGAAIPVERRICNRPGGDTESVLDQSKLQR
mgnify:CR=1 FL=1